MDSMVMDLSCPIKNNLPATNVAQTFSLPGPEGTPDSSGRALEHARLASR